MEAVAALLAGLPLQPEESDRGDLMEAKSQLFLKWVFFSNIFCISLIPFKWYLTKAKLLMLIIKLKLAIIRKLYFFNNSRNDIGKLRILNI